MNAPGQAEHGNLHAFQDGFAAALLDSKKPQVAAFLKGAKYSGLRKG